MKTGILLLFLLSFLLLSNSCSKLPPATKNGANTFGCLIDGKTWIPEGRGVGSGIYPTSGGFFAQPTGLLSIYIKAYSSNDEVKIYLKNISSVGTYSLNKNTSIMPAAVLPEASYGVYETVSGSEYVTDSAHIGTVKITYADTILGIVSGIFEMQVVQKTTGKVKNITNGRFDYKNH